MAAPQTRTTLFTLASVQCWERFEVPTPPFLLNTLYPTGHTNVAASYATCCQATDKHVKRSTPAIIGHFTFSSLYAPQRHGK